MRFLIIGASGFIGSEILTYTKTIGYKAIGTQSQSNYPNLITFNLLEHQINNCIKPDFFETNETVIVIVCALFGQTIDGCFLKREISYKVNVEKTILLLEQLKKFAAKVVFISTSHVYDGQLGYYNENSPHAPVCEYGRQKEAVEQFLQQELPDAFILRLDKVVGNEPTGNHLFSDWFQRIQKNEPIVCIEQIFSPTFVKDIAKAIVLGCQLELNGAYNVVNPEYFSRVELARQFAAIVGKPVEIILKTYEEMNFADSRPIRSYLDSSLFIKKTHIRFTTMREVIESFLFFKRYLKDNTE